MPRGQSTTASPASFTRPLARKYGWPGFGTARTTRSERHLPNSCHLRVMALHEIGREAFNREPALCVGGVGIMAVSSAAIALIPGPTQTFGSGAPDALSRTTPVTFRPRSSASS